MKSQNVTFYLKSLFYLLIFSVLLFSWPLPALREGLARGASERGKVGADFAAQLRALGEFILLLNFLQMPPGFNIKGGGTFGIFLRRRGPPSAAQFETLDGRPGFHSIIRGVLYVEGNNKACPSRRSRVLEHFLDTWPAERPGRQAGSGDTNQIAR